MIETPSGKDAAYENFPVGSWLLRREFRPHVAIFYAFARAIDDIADNPALTPDDKIARLNLFSEALELIEPPTLELAKAVALRKSLASLFITTRHGHDLISAFQQDAVKLRYQTWDDLIDYCNRSAAPVGRYLLDLHGEDQALWRYSDALCNALQVINHLQDCQDDYRKLNRVYLPLDYLDEFGAEAADLDRDHANAGLRQTFDRMLALTDRLMPEADVLPGQLQSWRLALESGVIVQIAHDLIAHLRRRDPLAERVSLSKAQFLIAAIKGAARTLMQRIFSKRKSQRKSP